MKTLGTFFSNSPYENTIVKRKNIVIIIVSSKSILLESGLLYFSSINTPSFYRVSCSSSLKKIETA
jgi:hypothetical protein